MGYLVFDIETVPDVESGRRLHGLEGLNDEDVAKAMTFHQLQATGSDFLPLHLQRVVAIAVVWRHRDTLRAYSLGEPDSDERELIGRFFDAIEKATPDKAVAALSKYGGTVLKSSLSRETEQQLQDALHGSSREAVGV